MGISRQLKPMILVVASLWPAAPVLQAAGAVDASEQALLVQQGRTAAMAFGKALKGELQAAMQTGGPVKAIDVCNIEAPKIAEQVSSAEGLEVGRRSLKNRNALNAPDGWERAVLERFEQRKAAGGSIKSLEYSEILETDGSRVFRYMKAIPTEALCLNCHGSELKPEVKSLLQKLYPDDRATGFQEGDIRGAFSIRKVL